MQQLVIDIEESRYALLLQFLKTLDYVKVLPPNPAPVVPTASRHTNQLVLLQQVLGSQNKPLFKHINDPVAWQKQQRDEWA
jgi:hypothetical protein